MSRAELQREVAVGVLSGAPTSVACAARRSRRGGRELRSAARRGARDIVLRLAGFAALIAVWILAAERMQEVQLPAPAAVWTALQDGFSDAAYLHAQGIPGGYWSNTLYTVSHALVGFAIGSAIGLAVGVGSARSRWIRNAAAPWLIVFGAVPPLVAAPFLLIWFGIGGLSQSLLVVLVSFVIVGINAQNAALTLSSTHEELAATLGVGPRRRFLTIVLPASLPGAVGALRVALSTAWSLQVAAELYGSRLGVGKVIKSSEAIAFTAGTIAIVAVLAVVASLIDVVAAGTLRYLVRWREGVRT